jgi:chemotaxis protein CheZ
MATQRKIFRIEETEQGFAPDAEADLGLATQDEILTEIRALRALVETRTARPESQVATQAQEVRKLKIELDVIGSAIKETRSEIVNLQDQGFDSSRVARVTKELEAVFGNTSDATDRILKAAEEIDVRAHTLAAILKNSNEKGLAQDIQEHVTAVFEACNFHDLTGQRISKVAATLKMVEEHLARMMEIWSVIERFNVDAVQSAADNLDGLLNGPKLDGDNGHSTQDEIDKLFH